MFVTQCVISLAVILIVTNETNCFAIQQTTLRDIVGLKSLGKLTGKFLDKNKKSKVISLNDLSSVKVISNTTDQNNQDTRLLDNLEDISNSKPLDLYADAKSSKDDKEESLGVLPLLIGLKASVFVVGVMTLIGLLTLKAFIASQTAILIAVVIGLKKLFSGNQKTKYEASHDSYSFVPEYHQISEHPHEPEVFKSHPEIPEQQLLGLYDLLKDQQDVLQDNQDMQKSEFQVQEISPEAANVHNFHGLFDSNLQETKLKSHKRRRNWKTDGERKPLSLVIGNPHHEPPILTYRKVVTGRNA